MNWPWMCCHWICRLQAATLAAAVRLLKLDIYSLKQAEDRFEQLLQLVSAIFTKQVDPTAVKECARTLAHSVDNSPASLKVTSHSAAWKAWTHLNQQAALAAQAATCLCVLLSSSSIDQCCRAAQALAQVFLTAMSVTAARIPRLSFRTGATL